MKEKFNNFVKLNPRLIDAVKNGDKTWQELYEIYTLYGEDATIWNNYLKDNKTGIEELIKMIQQVNLEKVKDTIDGMQKAISIIQSIGSSKKDNEVYENSKKYEDFDD